MALLHVILSFLSTLPCPTSSYLSPSQLLPPPASTCSPFPQLSFPRFFSSPLQEKVDPEQLALLVKREWQLSYATPLYAFRHTQLKAYSRQLSAFIAAEKQRGLAVEVGQESSFKVSFSVVPGVAETDDDAVTVLIQVNKRTWF